MSDNMSSKYGGAVITNTYYRSSTSWKRRSHDLEVKFWTFLFTYPSDKGPVANAYARYRHSDGTGPYFLCPKGGPITNITIWVLFMCCSPVRMQTAVWASYTWLRGLAPFVWLNGPSLAPGLAVSAWVVTLRVRVWGCKWYGNRSKSIISRNPGLQGCCSHVFCSSPASQSYHSPGVSLLDGRQLLAHNEGISIFGISDCLIVQMCAGVSLRAYCLRKINVFYTF